MRNKAFTGLLLSLSLFWCSFVVFGEDAQSPVSERIPFKPERNVEADSALSRVFGVVVLLAAAGGAFALYRKKKLGLPWNQPLTSDRGIVVMSRKTVAHGANLLVVRVEGKIYFIGQTATGFTLLDSKAIDDSTHA